MINREMKYILKIPNRTYTHGEYNIWNENTCNGNNGLDNAEDKTNDLTNRIKVFF